MLGIVGPQSKREFAKRRIGFQVVVADIQVTGTAAPTGTALIVVDSDGENAIVVVPGATFWSDNWGCRWRR